jgi:hypothetical protein
VIRPYCLLLAICPVCMALSDTDLSGLPDPDLSEPLADTREPSPHDE